MVAPKRYSHVLIYGSCEYELIWKKDLGRCNYIKDLEIRRSSWIMWMGPKSNDKCPYNRHIEEKAVQRQSTDQKKKKKRSTSSHQKLEDARYRFSSGASTRRPTLLTPKFWTFILQNCERVNFWFAFGFVS